MEGFTSVSWGRGDLRAPRISLGLTGPLFPSRQPCPRHASQPSHPFSWWPTGPGSRLEVHLSIHETAPAEQWHGTPPGFFGERTNESFFLQAIRIPRGTAIGRTVVCLVRTGKASQTVLPSVRPSTPSLWPIRGGNSVLAETKWVWGGRRIRWPRFWLPIRDSIGRHGIPPTFSARHCDRETDGHWNKLFCASFSTCAPFLPRTENVKFNGRQPAAKHAKPRRTSASFLSLPLGRVRRFPIHLIHDSRHLESDISQGIGRAQRAAHAKCRVIRRHPRRFKTRPGSFHHHLHPIRNKS